MQSGAVKQHCPVWCMLFCDRDGKLVLLDAEQVHTSISKEPLPCLVHAALSKPFMQSCAAKDHCPVWYTLLCDRQDSKQTLHDGTQARMCIRKGPLPCLVHAVV
eukprot:675132-Pelagomonas_calceolata.AAC.3